MGQKPDDWRTVSLCRDHHAEQHKWGERTFWRRVATDAEALIAAFIKASPRRAQIEQEIRERANG
jgi:anti-sigma-K factor RskA